MPMPVMQVWQVWMPVRQRLVPVAVAVRFGSLVTPVRMLMMFVMHMQVLVLQRFMAVFVFMLLGQCQPGRHHHQQARDQEADGQHLAQQRDGDASAHERRRAEVRDRSCAPQVSERVDEQHQAGAVTQRTDNERAEQGFRLWQLAARG